MDDTTKGWLLLATGIAIRYIIARRRFNRRGIGGLQHYRSYERAVTTSLFEWLMKWIAIGMILIAILHLLTGFSQKDKTNRATQQQAAIKK